MDEALGLVGDDEKLEQEFGLGRDNEQIELPAGFRFHPTDEELVIHYLQPKVIDNSFTAVAVGVVDFNKVEPWELPWRAKMGEREWYFFSLRDTKYPTGSRANRATNAGYWKATGKDKDIYKSKSLIGAKKTLVFYKGRAPKGEKTHWIMHEYRLESKSPVNKIPQPLKSQWVLSRVFEKSSGGKRIPFSGMTRMSNGVDKFGHSNLPLLLEESFPTQGQSFSSETYAEASHVINNSESMNAHQKLQQELAIEDFYNCSSFLASNDNINYARPANDMSSVPNTLSSNQFAPNVGDFQYKDSFWMPDQPMLPYKTYKLYPKSGDIDGAPCLPGLDMGQCFHGVQDCACSLGGPVKIASLWNY